MSSDTAVLIYPVHLFENIDSILPDKQNQKYKYYILEEPLYFSSEERIVHFNGLKLLLHRVSMKLYEAYLRDNGLDVEYIDFKDMGRLPEIVKTVKNIIYYDTVDHLLETKIANLTKGKNVTKLHNEGFICLESELDEYITAHKNMKRKFFHNDFYRWQRQRLNILMDESGAYLGGKLSFDKSNRHTFPKTDLQYPKYHTTLFNSDDEHLIISDATEYIKTNFPNHLGNLDEWHHIAFDFNTAKQKLTDFLKNRLKNFGKWEDIMDDTNPFIYHSLLSSSLNIGIITPDFVVTESIKYYEGHQDIIGINDIEGFIRQIIGWREYYRMVYMHRYDELVGANYLNHTNTLSKSWYTAETGIEPLDKNIKVAFKYGYLHHIIRLMLVGQFMLLCEIDPNEIYRWFMEFAIDSYDWVMVPNVYGMLGFNDGGETTTKPYISSSNYILKMSNYQKDGIWDITWRALYYNFIFKKKKILSKNSRTGRMIWQMNKLTPPALKELISEAELFIKIICETKEHSA